MKNVCNIIGKIYKKALSGVFFCSYFFAIINLLPGNHKFKDAACCNVFKIHSAKSIDINNKLIDIFSVEVQLIYPDCLLSFQ